MSQGPTVLPTIGVFSGLTEQGNINAALAALVSVNSGGSAPSSPAPVQGQPWHDTSVGGYITRRIFTGTTWQAEWTLDLSTGNFSLEGSAPQNWVAASGTHDAIAATYDPPVTALVDGMVLSFRATSANQTATPTFNPNGLGALTITKLGGATLWGADIPGSLAECQVRYSAANARWELISPVFSVPVCGIVPWFGGSVPSGFALPQGQNLSSTTYPIASQVLGTTYGNPGGGNFTMPDLRGRYFCNADAGGSGRITSAGGNFDGTVLGNTGGAQNRTLATGQIPQLSASYTPAGTIGGSQSFNSYSTSGAPLTGVGVSGAPQTFTIDGSSFTFSGNPTTITVGSGSPSAIPTLPPTMVVNCMMRIA